MRSGNASGIQITFLSFAVLLLAVPASSYVGKLMGASSDEMTFIGRFLPFVLGALVLAAFPALRRRVRVLLSAPIPREHHAEVALVAIGKLGVVFAFAGGLALRYWLTEGNAALEHHMKQPPVDEQMAQAFSGPGMLTSILIGAVFAPVLEEVLFRGLLYQAWERRWGWIPATLLTSTLFGLYHPIFWAAFTSSIIFVCLFRRTGSLWSSIAVHSFFNLMLWYPLVGQFVFPNAERAVGDISTWGLQLACLLFALIALPAYIWMSRKPFDPDALRGN